MDKSWGRYQSDLNEAFRIKMEYKFDGNMMLKSNNEALPFDGNMMLLESFAQASTICQMYASTSK